MQKIFEKSGCHRNEISPRPLQWIHKMRHKSESAGILEPKGKTDFLIAV